MNNNNEKSIGGVVCPFCGGEIEYKTQKGTHSWVCTECPVVMFEYYDENDIENVAESLK